MEKTKRKNSPTRLRWLYGLLFIWVLVSVLAAFYPPIWLAPPLIGLTPYIYLSMLWGGTLAISVLIWNKRRQRLPLIRILLLLSIAFLIPTMQLNKWHEKVEICETVNVRHGTLYHCRWLGSCYDELIFKKVYTLPLATLTDETFPFGAAMCL